MRPGTGDQDRGPGQREESQRGTTITLRQPEIRLRFDILCSRLLIVSTTLSTRLHNTRLGRGSSLNELDLATWFPRLKEGRVT